MTYDEATRVLKRLAKREPLPWTPLLREVEGKQALDIAIAVLEREGEANKTIPLRGNALKAATDEKLKDYTFDASQYIALDPVPAVGNQINHSGDSTDMVTPFNERVDEAIKAITMDGFLTEAELLADMQEHIRLLNSAHELQQSSILDMLKEVQRKNALLLEAADEIESYVEHEYPKETRDNYPVTQRRYKRDMEIVNRIREEAVK